MNNKLKEIQASIDKTEYCDAQILSFQATYFGDEVEVVIENDTTTAWKISFMFCYSVEYTTDAHDTQWRRNQLVRDMTRRQLCYYGQDITVKNCAEVEGFYEVNMDLSIFTAKIICKDILVELIEVNRR